MFPIVIVHDFLQEHQKGRQRRKGGNKLVDKTTSQSKFAYNLCTSQPVSISATRRMFSKAWAFFATMTVKPGPVLVF